MASKPTKEDFERLDSNQQWFKEFEPMDEENWKKFKEIDPLHFALLSNVPFEKQNNWIRCQKDAKGNWQGMYRSVFPYHIWECYFGGGWPCYSRYYTNECKFEGLESISN
eukprot:CAMPEP_0168617968 /NCGR_PEP_ID=MMETSP0449_2-20121227/5821_1 /TAXON_ID=1082188 /ORGANISM="Strombidium rassoulzadegani, Strain ras09" /LENGTH=109 /DNA_ID=CAMNT_0008658811 /DNA_START=122 /DNA_END=448 /DNA_ORIENTATION=+